MHRGPEIFERAARARARLLRVARTSGAGPAGLALTFDAGLIVVEVDRERGGLAISHPEEGDAVPATGLPLDEEEPWWRLLGHALTEARPSGDGPREVALRFREPDDDPRVVTLASRGGAVAAILEPSGV